MDHFKGVVPEERYKNDVLNELRQIRILLQQLVPKEQPEKPKRQYKRREKDDHSLLGQEHKEVRRSKRI